VGVRIALAGNPNCGKTTLFNALTGSNQFVGNWPGVTVEKKEGKLKGHKDVVITDLPGIYSLSPYTLEEVVARNYLIDERPDAILNIVDGTNLERNLYLTTQLVELSIPVVVAINMMDVIERNGDKINVKNLQDALGVPVVEISALKATGIEKAAEKAVEEANSKKVIRPKHSFSGSVEHAFAHIEEYCLHDTEERLQRWYALKLFERDDKIQEKLGLSEEKIAHIEKDILSCEEEMDDDAESIITAERYNYIGTIIGQCLTKAKKGLTVSDKIDRVVTNRWLGLPIFALVMFVVYYVSVTTVGTWATDWTNDQLLGDDGWNFLGIEGLFIPGLHGAVGALLENIGCADWLAGLINDGIIAGVGAVLGFVPQILILFIFLGFLESCGYLARVAFIMDRIFRKFGLSGKSFIPMLIGSGCGIPGIMASRTIENERDRRMTIMTTTFVPCGAKLPIIALIAGAFFHNSGAVAVSAYFVGVAAIICSGIILKKTKMFAGDPSPFVMELPAYHWPTVENVLRSMWERGWSFIKKAGTIILLSTIVLWFLMSFGTVDGTFRMLDELEIDHSILAAIGGALSFLFKPLGFGTWQLSVAAITGLIAKENVVATLGMTYGIASDAVEEAGDNYWDILAASVPAIAGYSYLVFNLLCAPCFAAMGAIKREMNNAKWFWFAIGYQCALAWVVSLCIFQLGGLLTGAVSFGFGTVVALCFVIGFIWLLFRKGTEEAKEVQM
jgi:ferrous iron transport protein B